MASHLYELQENAIQRSSSGAWCPTSLTTSFFLEGNCQGSFWPGHSTVDMIFSLRQLQEKCAEQQRSLYITFVDLTKVFDTPDRNRLWKLLPKFGCPSHLTNIIHHSHEGMVGRINMWWAIRPISHQQWCKTGLCLSTYSVLFFAVVLQVAWTFTGDHQPFCLSS